MKRLPWKSRPMTVWEKVGATFVAAVLLLFLYRVASYLIETLHFGSH